MGRDAKCTKCPLSKSAASVCVWGEKGGNRVDLFILGEAPGREEDGVGRPFVGRSGQALRQVLGDLHLLDRAFITNVCKCRPPNNRPPKRSEVLACEPYWREELATVKPKYLVLLGASAVKAVTGERTVALGTLRGRKAWTVEGANVIATYHPAAALRTPELWDKIVDDLSRIDSEEFTHAEEIKWKVWDGKTPIPSPCALDIETTGLNPFGDRDHRVLTVAWSNRAGQAVASDNIPAVVKALQQKRDRVLIGHNLKFDLLWLQLAGYTHTGEVIDTRSMGHLVDENTPSTGLKWWASQITGLGDYDKEIATDRSQGFGNTPIIDILKYNAYDAGATWLLYQRLLPEVKKQGLGKLVKFQGRLSKALVEVERGGISLDLKEVKRQEKRLVSACAEIERRFAHYDVNLGSPKQLGELLYQELKLRIPKKTPTGVPSTDEEALSMIHDWLPDTDERKPLIKALLQYRDHRKMLSTYLEGVPKHLGYDGRVHPSFNAQGTVTGRFSCSAPNLQNIPRAEGGPKRIFCADSPGSVLVEADFSQIELRIGAMLSRDEAMMEAFLMGRDLHAETAKALWGVTVENTDFREKRSLAKTINFGIFYGMSPDKFSRETGASPGDARKFIARWFAAYPGVKRYLQEVEAQVMDQGWVENLFGRRRRLPVQVADRAAYAHAIRQACNFPVQSSAADLTNMVLTWLVEDGFDVRVTVHDSLVVHLPKEEQAEQVGYILAAMSKPAWLVKQFGFNIAFPVPILAEAKVGHSWGEMKGV